MDVNLRREQLIDIFRRRHHVTAEQLAGDLGVSRRTVLRDVETLRRRGFLIESDAGPGGGFRMDPRAALVSPQLTSEEVVALILSVELAEAMSPSPFGGAAKSALRKIERSLGAPRVADLRRLIEMILIATPAKNIDSATVQVVSPEILTVVERGFTEQRLLDLDYADQNGTRTTRTIEPHGLLVRAPLFYILAWDVGKDQPRTFRMDRIQRLELSGDRNFASRRFELLQPACPDAVFHKKSTDWARSQDNSRSLRAGTSHQ